MSAAITSKPPTVKLPSTTVSIRSDRVGAVLEQPAACVTLSGVGTVATTAAPLDSVVLEVVPSYRQAQVAGSPPRHASTSSKWCVVVLCSRYSCSSVHSSSTVHVESAVQRQQVDAELNCRGLAGSSDGGPRCCRRRPGDTPRLRNVAATSKPPTVRLPSTTVSICSDKVGGVLEQPAACVTLSGVGTVAIAAELLDSVVLEVVPSYCQAQVAGSLPRHALTSSKWFFSSSIRGTHAAPCTRLGLCMWNLRPIGSKPMRSLRCGRSFCRIRCAGRRHPEMAVPRIKGLPRVALFACSRAQLAAALFLSGVSLGLLI